MVKVWCEWDMGFSNINDNESVFNSKEEAVKILEKIDWSQVDYESWEKVEEDGLLSIYEID